MLQSIAPKLPMSNKVATKAFYIDLLGFHEFGTENLMDYMMLKKDQIELHFFHHADLNPLLNDGQVYIRVQQIELYYYELLKSNVSIHPNGHLSIKPWRMREFALLDPDHNLLTFGEEI